ncbi:MAG: ATP-binding protein [Cellvibrionales bacterium]|nr:ATP-binding protein [Cellvibrionales bacterium]
MLLGKNFDAIDSATLQELIDGGASESVHLEFKRDTYGNADADKKEMLKDITAFANTLGGHSIIGMDEEHGTASALSPLACDVDKELQRLESIARTGVEPAIVGLRMKRIDLEGGSLILIHVPKSFNPPHRVIYKNSNRYYGRTSSGACELSMEDLRLLFGAQRSIEERAKAFIGERFLRIQDDDGFIPLPVSEGVLVMHLVPLPDFGAARRIEFPNSFGRCQRFDPIGSFGHRQGRFNLEGYCFYRFHNPCRSYTQVFRDGSLEATSVEIIDNSSKGARIFQSSQLRKFFIDPLKCYLYGLRQLESSPPILMQISATNIQGAQMCENENMFAPDDFLPSYDRETLHLPSTMITAYRDDGNYESIIAEQMHFLWNAFGLERCPQFDEEGNYIGQ